MRIVSIFQLQRYNKKPDGAIPKNEVCTVRNKNGLRNVEFRLGLLATGTAPVVGQVFEGHAVVLSRVIDVATDGADVFSGGFFLFENNFRSAR